MWESLRQWDRDLFVYLNNLGVGNYDAFWVFVTKIEHWIPLYFLFFILLYKVYERRRAFIGTLLTILTFSIVLVLTQLTKILAGRPRPNNTPELAQFIRVLQTPENFSFFSGHAAVSFAVTTFVVLALRSHLRWVYLFFLWPLLFIMSRIFVGVHYPSDIIVGALVGTLVALFVWKYLGKNKMKKDLKSY